ncbi:MAG: SPFH/Band 7/PHB domain protein [Sulfurimonas sp.]|jgi:regulator of protease activity HflC (stomatin/prohibitin superfamily)|nr:SPFH/Band 7/PHB domain protein [Sulfurimonas sp.]MBU1216076.1 SPFH/Band 7/PHB domain protein [bacterium]MBU1434382.1 SPFH/Band 7/PHB domain protein [bacterium]MBU1501960.1 SPFH/Band 7/PHB domain protein [bacterium]MBU3939617.1 SPFH/Band 7/PHB domain protein [bacterium]
MDVSIVFSLVLVAGVVYTLSQMVRIVPQGEEWVIERLGKYNKTLLPGLSLLIPVVDNVAYKIVTKELIQQTRDQEVITKDNAVVIISAVVFYRVTDPGKASYSISNFESAVANMTTTTLRAVIGGMTLNESLSQRDQIKAQVALKIRDSLSGWGLTLGNLEVQDIRPSANLQEAMERQAAADREREATIMIADGEKKASIAQAEGQKQAAILEAEGKLEAAKLEAEAKVELANGDRKAIMIVGQGLAAGDIAPNYLLAQRYIDSVKNLAESDNSKVVFMPADWQKSLAGVVGSLSYLGNAISDKE